VPEFVNFILAASPAVIFVVIVGYYLNAVIIKKIDGLEARVTAIVSTSLDIKKDLRNEERAVLVEFRANLMRWEDFLLRMLTEYANQSASQSESNSYYERDSKLFLDVRIAAVKASIYLRDQALERRLMASISKIRALYSPLIAEAMSQLISLQSQLIVIDIKMKKSVATGLADLSIAPTEADLQQHKIIDTQMTEVLKQFSDKLLVQYPPIAKELDELKVAINAYIYRSVDTASLSQS
jgi:hypothetical protein